MLFAFQLSVHNGQNVYGIDVKSDCAIRSIARSFARTFARFAWLALSTSLLAPELRGKRIVSMIYEFVCVGHYSLSSGAYTRKGTVSFSKLFDA